MLREFSGAVLLSAVIATLLLSGCDSSADVPNTEQENFILKLRRLSSELDQVKGTQSGKDGKLPPRNTKDRIKEKEREIDNVMHIATPTAVLWNAEIDSLERTRDLIIFHAEYKEQRYELKIFDEQAKQIVETNFARGDKIAFSGSIGPERSLTQLGGFLNPEFSFYPTFVQKSGSQLTQSAESIDHLLAKQNQLTKEEQLAGQIESQCKQSVVNILKYPASAHFAWFQSEMKKVSDKRWEYRGVIESTNDFGGTIPQNFKCTANIFGDKMRVRVTFE